MRTESRCSFFVGAAWALPSRKKRSASACVRAYSGWHSKNSRHGWQADRITRWATVRTLLFRNCSDTFSRFLTERHHSAWSRASPLIRKAILSAQLAVWRRRSRNLAHESHGPLLRTESTLPVIRVQRWLPATSPGGCLGDCCEGLRRCHHQQDRRAVDRNRFRCQSRLEKEKCLGAVGFCRCRRIALHQKPWLEASHADGAGYTLSANWEIKMETPHQFA